MPSRASVKVVAAGKAIPSAKADAAAVAKQLAAEVRLARKLQSFTPPATTTIVSGGHDSGQVAVLKFFAETVHVPVDGTVKFEVKTKPRPHTFTLGPADYRRQVSNNFVMPTKNPAGLPMLVIKPLIPFASDPPPALPAYEGTQHGNGFLTTGIRQGGRPGPDTAPAAVTFTKAGTYAFQCMVRDSMKGKVIVG